MRRASFLESAREDLLEILSYLTEASDSISSSLSFVRDLRAQCHKLASLPGTVGRLRPDLAADVRSFPYKSYVIFFRYAGSRFEVIDIVERHLDVEGRFKRRRDPP